MNKYRFWSIIILAASVWAVFYMWADYRAGEKAAGFNLGLEIGRAHV